MRVVVLGSGSSGNALLVDSCGTRLLIEAGIGPKVAERRLAELGIELEPGALHGIVATHRHGDHFGYAEKLSVAFGAPLFLHQGIPSPSAPLDVRSYEVGRTFRVGELSVSTVLVPHDVAHVALRIDDGAQAFAVATDVGRVTPGLVSLLAECDEALVEANHCAQMLATSDYPETLKRRIGGGLGHLSNDQTAELAARLVGSRLTRMWLGHLSRLNNTPERALDVVGARATRIDVAVVPATSPVSLNVRSTRPYQLGLPFDLQRRL